MKTGFLRSWKLVIVLAGLPVASVSLSDTGFIATAQEAVASADVPTTGSPDQPTPQAAIPAPPDVKLSPGAAEIAKLAQAGLGEDVMMAYVSNVNSTFNLGSDQILYLNDLGVSGTVVKAMIQRDAQYSAEAQAWAAANQPSVTPPQISPAPADDVSYPSEPVDNSVAENPGDMVDYVDSGNYSTTDDTGYFYNSLAPYGSWINVSGAGLCWQPTVCRSNHDWQPYCDRGRWIYTDCGWYWRSDYSWGWAAFHYGRWFNTGSRGWCWRPDHVWGPAWVSWRQSGDYCGWAPLPPSAHFVPGSGFQHRGHSVPSNFDFGLHARHYTFIPVGRMTDYAPNRYATSSSKSADLFNRSAVVNNVTFEHNRVINHAIDPKQVAAASGIEVRKAEIHETPSHPNTTVISDHLAKQGNSLMIFRPTLSSPTPTGKPGHLFSPPSKTPGGFKTSLNNSAPTATASPAVQHAAAPLPNMNFSSMAPASQPTKTEFYPAGSMVVVGAKSANNSGQSTPSRLPNMNFAHQPSQPAKTYASATPHSTYEPSQSQYNNQVNYGARPEPQPAQTFGGYRQEPATAHFAPSQPSQVVVPSHFTVASRLESHSAYTVYGSTSSEHVPQNHSSEFTGYSAPAHHSSNVESHSSHTEHVAEHSAPAAVSHSSGSSSSSSSSSGHR